MSLFPDLEIYGHGSKGGLDPNGSPLQALLQRNQFEERQRGEPFRTMLGARVSSAKEDLTSRGESPQGGWIMVEGM